MRDILKSFMSNGLQLTGQGSLRRRRSGYKTAADGFQNAACERLEDRALLAAQNILSDAPVKQVAAGETVDIPIVYQTTDDNGAGVALKASLIDFNLHFDADALTFVEVINVFQEGLQGGSIQTLTESKSDNDAATDTVLKARYTDTDAAQDAGWPNSHGNNGRTLYVARFTAKAGFSGTSINFTDNETGAITGQSGTFDFSAASLILQAPSGPTISISNASAVSEGGNAVFNVTLSAAMATAVTVNYSTVDGDGPTGALAGEDYTAKTDQTLTFAPGETQKQITIATTDDALVEATETFDVTLSNASGVSIGNATAQGTIADNDDPLPRISAINASPVTEGEVATFTVRLNVAADSAVTVKYRTADGNGPSGATDGVDLTAISNQTLTFAAGETEKTVTVTTLDDDNPEPAETFELQFFDSVGATIATPAAIGTINDNDAALPSLSISDAAAVAEGSDAVFTVTLSEAAASDVTVRYSTANGAGPTGAVAGADFSGHTNTQLTFTPGETSKTITITTVDDTLPESNETFSVVLSGAGGAVIGTATATGTINDNDGGGNQGNGNVDGDSDFDASDAFMIHLVKLSGTNTQIDQSKGSSPLTAAQIRANIDQLGLAADVDGNGAFNASDSFLIQLVKLSGTNTQIDQSKGSSALTAAQIRANVDSLGNSASGSSSRVAAVRASFGASSSPQSEQDDLFDDSSSAATATAIATPETGSSDDLASDVWGEFRSWIDTI